MSKIQVTVMISGVEDTMELLKKIKGLDTLHYEVNVVVAKGLENNQEMVKLFDFCDKYGMSCKTAEDLDLTPTNLPSKRKSTSSRESSVSRDSTVSLYKSVFEEHREIGRGAYGRVFLCKNTLDGMLYAIKQIPFSESRRTRYSKEPSHMAQLHHKNIVRYHQAWIEDGAIPLSESEEYSVALDELPITPPTKTMYISMEYCPSSLADKIKEGLSREEIPSLARQMLEGVAAIHSSGIIHRDISKSNILLGHDGLVRFTDFGLAITGDKESSDTMFDMSDCYGQAVYKSPEMQGENPRVCAKSDMFSVGLIIFEMVYPMQSDMERNVTFDKIRAGKYDWSEIDEREDLHFLLAKDPTLRASARELLGDEHASRFWNSGWK